ncbi:MAG: hypothetical protein R6V00_00425 [Candidatus Aminicenantes bacterium]
MKETYTWNPYSDQPDISIPKKKRFWHHIKRLGSYVSLTFFDVCKAPSIISLYRKYRKSLYQNSCLISDPFGVSLSSAGKRNDDLVRIFKETGALKTLIRVHSWEKEKLQDIEALCHLLKQEGLSISIALLQDRKDILNPTQWKEFVDLIFSKFKKYSSFFEIGHAWNRAKWGLWDYKEYLKLSLPAFYLAKKHKVKLMGPAVIDFEFHLYPPILKKRPFDIVSSLLYVDRVGAPENKQYGWDTSSKVALLRAVVDKSFQKSSPLWITEVNWPLKGTGKYSPVSGEPNVTEEEQASYLVRYYVLCLATGFVDRIYWWQLIAPGYGLVDSREEPWRKRPSFYSFKTLVQHLRGAEFIEKVPHSHLEIFAFQKEKQHFSVVWAKKKNHGEKYGIPGDIKKIISRDGKELPSTHNKIKINGNPCYVYFR